MSKSLSIQDFNAILARLPQTEMDDAIGLNSTTGKLTAIKDTNAANVAPASETGKKSSGGFFSLFSSRNVQPKPTSPNPPIINFSKVRTDLFEVVNQKLKNYSIEGEKSNTVESHKDIYSMLIGDGNNQKNPSKKPLSARQIKYVLEKTSSVALDASIKKFNAQNSDLVNEVDVLRVKLYTVKQEINDKEIKGKIEAVIKHFDKDIKSKHELIKQDYDDIDVFEQYKQAYETFAKSAKDVLQKADKQKVKEKEEELCRLKQQEAERLAKIEQQEKAAMAERKRLQDEAIVKNYHKQIDDGADAFAKNAKQIIEHLKGELLASYEDNDPYLSKDEIKAAFEELDDEIEGICKSEKEAAQKVTTETMNLQIQDISKHFSQKLSDLQAHANSVHTNLKAKHETGAKLALQAQVFEKQCEHELYVLKEKCNFELEDGFTQLWEESFGDSDADGRRETAKKALETLSDEINKAAQDLVSTAKNEITKQLQETPKEQKQRFTNALTNLSNTLKAQYETLCKHENELISKEKKTRQDERTKLNNEIVQNYRDQMDAIVNEFDKIAKNKLNDVSPDTKTGKELWDLYNGTKADLEELTTALNENATPQTTEKCLDEVIDLVNGAYVLLAAGKHATKSETFAANLNNKISTFESAVTDAINDFKTNWNLAFPNNPEQPRLGQAGLDRKYQAIIAKLTKMGETFAAEAWVKFDVGTKELPPNIDNLFNTEVQKIITESQNQLDNAQQLEILREHNSQMLDDALSIMEDLTIRVADLTVSMDFRDAKVDESETTMQRQLHDKYRELFAFLYAAHKNLHKIEDISPYALSVATRQINNYVMKFDKAIVAANGDPAKLLARLEGIKLPELIFKTLDEDLADEAFFRNANDISGLESIVSPEVKNALKTLKTAMLTKYESIKELKDLSARYAFQKVAREAFDEIAEAVKNAASNGINLTENDITTIIKESAWRKITQKYVQLVNASFLENVEQVAESARLKLEQALVKRPNKFSNGLVPLRANVYNNALQTFAAHMDAMREKLSELSEDNCILTKDAPDQILNDLTQKVSAFIRDADNRGSYATQAPQRAPRALTFISPESWVAEEQQAWNIGAVSENFNSLEALVTTTKEQQDRNLQDRKDQWDNLLDTELTNVEGANRARKSGVVRQPLPEEPKIVKGATSIELKRQEMAKNLTAVGKQIEKIIEAKGIEEFESQQKRAMEFKKQNEARLQKEQEEAQRIAREKQEEAQKLEAEQKEKEKLRLQEQKRKEEKQRLETKKRESFNVLAAESLKTCENKLRKSFSLLFLNCAGMDRYHLVDEFGNHAGWNDEGKAIIESAIAKQMTTEKETAYTLFDGEKIRGELGDVSDADAVKLLNEARVQQEKKPGAGTVVEEHKSHYPQGSNVFGIDANQLTPEQRAGLKCLVRSFMLSLYSDTNDPKKYSKKINIPYPTDEVVEKVLLSNDFQKKANNARQDLAVKALSKGLNLSTMTLGYANLLLKSSDLLMSIKTKGMGSELMCGLEIEDLYELSQMYTTLGITPKFVESLSMMQANTVVLNLGLLRLLNNRRNEGLDAICQRVFGMDVKTFVTKSISREDKNLTTKILKLSNVVAGIGVPTMTQPHPTWRADWDPLVAATDAEKKAVAILEHRHAFGPDDKTDVEAFRTALANVRKLNVGGRVAVLIANTQVELKKTDKLHISAMVNLSTATIKRNTDDSIESISHDSKKLKAMPVSVPVTIDALADGLDETILGHVETYGTQTVLNVLNAKINSQGKNEALVSSRTRQLCVSVLRSYAGLTTDKLCFASTEQLINLTRGVLSEPKYAGLSVTERGKLIQSEKLIMGVSDTMLNTNATLELYRKYQKRCQQDQAYVNSKVHVPNPARVRKDETPEQALTRRIHEFAADLIQLHDTTKFDLEHANGTSDVDLMRDVLLNYRTEVEALLNDNSNQKLETFTFSVGQQLKLNAFTVSMKKLVGGLRKLCIDHNYDTLFQRIANPNDAQVAKLLSESRASFNKNSTDVIKNLQGIFKNEFSKSFAKIAGDKGQDMWRMSLSELTNTSTIDPSQGYGAFLQKVIGQYFIKMSEVDRNRMAAQVMRFATDESSIGQLLGSLLKGAGPILQKFMQGLPQSALPEILREAVADIKSNLAPIPEEAVRAYLLDVVEESHGYIQNITVKKSLGAASVGQAFLCVVKTEDHPEGEECVIKILRPDAQSRAHREENFFRKMAGDTDVLAMLEDRFARIYEELDLTVESDNVVRGGVYDPEGQLAGDVTVRSMKLHPAANSTSNVMFLRLAPGETYDRLLENTRKQRKELEDYLDKEYDDRGMHQLRSNDMYDKVNTRIRLLSLYTKLSQRQNDLCHLVTRWTEEVAFLSGFFHGDVHAGNIMASDTGLTVIDFGNATKLTELQRTNIMFMLINAYAKQPGEFLKNVGDLLPASSKETFAKLKEKNNGKIYNDLSLIFDKGSSEDVGKRFIAALQYLQNSGVELPASLFNLMECMRRLDESINAINQEMAEIKNSALSVRGMNKIINLDSCYWFDKKFAGYVNDYLSKNQPITVNEINAIHEKLTKSKYLDELKTQIKAACGTRKGYEELMTDVRLMSKRVNLVKDVDYHFKFMEILTNAERNPTLFDSSNKDAFTTAQEQFADKLARQLVEMQSKLVSQYGSDGVDGAFLFLPTPNTFADAVSEAVSNNIDKIREKIGAIKGLGLFKAQKAVKAAENAREARIDIAEDRINKDFKLLDSEKNFLRKHGLYFDAPLKFSDMLASSKWAKYPDNRHKALEVFRNALSRMRSARADTTLKEHPIGGEPSNIVFVRVMATYFFAQYKVSGFENLDKSDLTMLLQEADSDNELKVFINEVYNLAHPHPTTSKKKNK